MKDRLEMLEARKRSKKYQGAKMEEVQARSQGRKNRTIRIGIPNYLVFPEEIESD
jgi:hypothetical protein